MILFSFFFFLITSKQEIHPHTEKKYFLPRDIVTAHCESSTIMMTLEFFKEDERDGNPWNWKRGLKTWFSIRLWKRPNDDNFVFPTSLTSSHSFSWQVGRNWRGKRKAMVCLYECNFEYELETIGSFNEIGRTCVRVYTYVIRLCTHDSCQ